MAENRNCHNTSGASLPYQISTIYVQQFMWFLDKCISDLTKPMKSSVKVNRSFGEIYCLHLPGRGVSKARNPLEEGSRMQTRLYYRSMWLKK
jgi:hypothetical protein